MRTQAETRQIQRIFGVDPGSRLCGWGIIEAQGSDVRHIASGVIKMPAKMPLHERLGELLTAFSKLLDTHQVDVLAIEQAFVHKNPRTALVIGQARGLPIAVAAARGVPVSEYQPSVIKRAVVGSGRATKEQVTHMVQLQLGLTEPPQEDEGDALAVAITHSRDAALSTVTAAPASDARAYYAAVVAGARGRKRR
ncbi:MAG: crossover junction endodeoxyribonuclease RuvC [Myxococcales bacterium]|nr:crossover junction endodeoxyribonuclease RuvC [Myxococcales bacterium]